ncbi:MAG: efflux RND transporter periplasmic adaptor subunit [bacterium]|nr:efflux RND transporter periplasmic adaptor subunit [bacterium]
MHDLGNGIVSSSVTVGDAYDLAEFQGRACSPVSSGAKVSAVSGGKILKILADVGSEVKKGDIICEIFGPELARRQSDYIKAGAVAKAAGEKAALSSHKVKSGASGKALLDEAEASLLSAKSAKAQAVSEYEKAKSELVQCRARYERALELYGDKIISAQDFDTAKTEYERDQAALANAEIQKSNAERQEKLANAAFERTSSIYRKGLLDSSEIAGAESEAKSAAGDRDYAARMIVMSGGRLGASDGIAFIDAPVSGIISDRKFSLGQNVPSGETVFSIAPSSIEYTGNAYEKAALSVRKGQKAEIRAKSLPDRFFNASVLGVSSEMDPETGTFAVRLSSSDGSGIIKSGTPVRISVITGVRKNAVLVPKECVLDESGRKIVFGRHKHGAECEKITVETGSLCGNNIEIKSGLTPKSEVIIKGQSQLKTSFGSVELKAGCADGCGGE